MSRRLIRFRTRCVQHLSERGVRQCPQPLLRALRQEARPRGVDLTALSQVEEFAYGDSQIELIDGAEPSLHLVSSGNLQAMQTELVEETGFPVTSTLMGLGAYPASSEKFLGMLGMHGTYEANWAMHDCDVMLCVGARFDDRITGRIDAFAPHSLKIHIDIDPSSIGKTVRADVGIVADCGDARADCQKAGPRAPRSAHTRPTAPRQQGWRSRSAPQAAPASHLAGR